MKELFKLVMLLLFATNMILITSCSDDDDPMMEEEMMEEEMETVDPTVAALEGSWVLAQTVAALAVGPAEGSADWWFNSEEDLATRSCQFDDVWTFGTDGSLSIELDDETWIEAWQGVDPEACAAPVAPHVSGDYTYEANESSITINGEGAFIGLAKVINGGELSAEGTAVPASRTYSILEMSTDPKTMKLGIAIAGEGNWTFNLVEKQ